MNVSGSLRRAAFCTETGTLPFNAFGAATCISVANRLEFALFSGATSTSCVPMRVRRAGGTMNGLRL